MSSKKMLNYALTRNLPIIKCECGYEILLIPDLVAMGNAIEKHVLEHKANFALTHKATEAVELNLVAQAFSLISELEAVSEVLRNKDRDLRV